MPIRPSKAPLAAPRPQAQEHGHIPAPLLWITGLLLVAAFLRPVPRVVGFVLGGAAATSLYGAQLLSWLMGAELALYVSGAALFLRNAGHARWAGWSDHHLLHYFVTVAGVLHVLYIWRLVGAEPGEEGLLARIS